MSNPRTTATLGTFYCVLSALGYTTYNICLRFVSDKQDATWVNCVQASVGASIVGIYLASLALRGRPALPPWRDVFAMLALGFITQLGGILTIWAMSIVGVSVTGTLQMGVMLAASAILGLIVLGEKVTYPQVAAIIMITASVVLFSIGTQAATEASAAESVQTAVTPFWSLLGIGAGILGGIAFAILTVGIRKMVSETTSPAAAVFLINFVGAAAFAPWCIYHVGIDAMIHTPLDSLGAMLAAGFMNLIGFYMVTKSLQMITVVRVNVINNGLVSVLTVIAGISMFAEPCNREISIGIFLSIAGTLLISLIAPPDDAANVAEAVANTSEGLAHDNPTH